MAMSSDVLTRLSASPRNHGTNPPRKTLEPRGTTGTAKATQPRTTGLFALESVFWNLAPSFALPAANCPPCPVQRMRRPPPPTPADWRAQSWRANSRHSTPLRRLCHRRRGRLPSCGSDPRESSTRIFGNSPNVEITAASNDPRIIMRKGIGFCDHACRKTLRHQTFHTRYASRGSTWRANPKRPLKNPHRTPPGFTAPPN